MKTPLKRVFSYLCNILTLHLVIYSCFTTMYKGMKATIYINGVVGEDINLLDVIRQFKSYSNPSEVEVIIDSVGGSVSVGQSIFSYLRGLELPITTVAKQAYSIAASIFMAGDTRIAEAGMNRLMIHLPFAQVQGGSKYLDEVSKELKALENDFVKFYSTYTNISEQSIRTLLENETFISGEDAVELGLATEVRIPLQAVAFYNIEKEEKTMSKVEKFMNALNAFFTEEVEVKALVLQDANGTEISFDEVAEDAQPTIGDKATVDGSPASGEYVSPDGEVWVFEGGTLSEVKPAEVEEEETEEATEEVEDVEVDASAEEVETVEATEEVETAVETETEEEELNFEELIKLFEERITAKLQEENKELKAEITAMKKLIGSEDVTITAQNTQPNTNNNGGMTKSASILSTLKNRK